MIYIVFMLYIYFSLIWHFEEVIEPYNFLHLTTKKCMLTFLDLDVISSRAPVFIRPDESIRFQIFLRHKNIDEKYCYDAGCLHDLKLNERVRAN